ncbi:polyphosphate kinase 2 family protein [Rudanella paleaurantiibacter]|uniref:Polyphosphate kinase 2 family protein n=1 Tax=Rudanella paleaurantiibacter TaxID=2614655 RepID=A0A7J5TZP7_9BACT|nr:PPK2 family polyphosphate kinase [Rudanella paleaurantiibacter]KAB7730920.1 polyphosphate kinase 2 family protein [Rudanella paleaurantiibacter]
MTSFDIESLRFDGKKAFRMEDAATKIDDLYTDDVDYEIQLRHQAAEIADLQTDLYADNRYGLVAIFQAMDAAGKDGTIQHVFTGTNPLGLRITSFKRPTDQELEHDWLWRSWRELPERGTIGVFNRSYYEEVLVVRVHPEILTQSQRLPTARTDDLDKVWKHRFEAIRDVEKHLYRNGFPVIKFFLHVSKEEQADRLIKRIENPEKHWKFDEGDVKERGFWNEYMAAFEEAINETATSNAPWYVIPADDKKNMRLMVSRILLSELKKLPIHKPEVDEERAAALKKLIKVIKEQ